MECDVVVVGGAFSGAATALLLRRELPGLKVLVIERSTEFDRKVGEATTEISGSFLTKRLSLTHHLAHNHIVKHGLRFWFSNDSCPGFEHCGELGSAFQTRMPTFQVDRAVLDEHLLALAQSEGAELWRPAKLVSVDFADRARPEVVVERGGEKFTLRPRWVIDASGRASVLARQMKMLRQLPEHPTNAIWARFRNVKDMDGHEMRSRSADFAGSCQVSRCSATNHLTGYGWWVWIIPLKGGDTSVGLVYDQRLYSPPDGTKLSERLKAHLVAHPMGRELFADAEAVEGDVKAYSSLPYFAENVAGPSWQIVGDAAGFMDPLYSQGLDYCAWTVSSAVDRIVAESRGESVCIKDINHRFATSYRAWFDGLYKDKYHYLGDSELMRAAFLMDLGLFFFGPVRSVVECARTGFARFPFDGPVDGMVGRFMKFYNARLAALGRARHDRGGFDRANVDSRFLVKGFEPNANAWKMVAKGARVWIAAEIRTLLRTGRVATLRQPATA